MTREDIRMKHCHALVSKIVGFRSDGEFSDIDMIVGGQVFKCHRIVLSAASEYFDKMFTGPLTESSTNELSLEGINAKVFEEILKFVYTGEVVIHISNVNDMVRAADSYNLPLMLQLCTEFAIENVSNARSLDKMMTELDQRKYCHALLSNMAVFRSDDKFSDINVIVGGEVFKCHRLILSAASEYFDKMLTGPFTESSSKEVVLLEIKVCVFKEILKFIYTGDAEISISNIYDIICAADYFNLPLVIELCIEFVKKNFNALAEDILRIFSLAHRLGFEGLIELLCGHIYQNFYYFIGRPEFFDLTWDSLMEVLHMMCSYRPTPQDVCVEGFYQWIMHQKDLSLVNKELYLTTFMEIIDFTKLSSSYTSFRMSKLMKDVILNQSNDSDNDSDACKVILRPTRVPIAYVSVKPRREETTGVSIFTMYEDGNINKWKQYIPEPQYEWTYSGELGYPVNFMRNVFIDDCLYSLRYIKQKGAKQSFCSGTSVLMYPSLTLTSPPCILDTFDLCGARNDIYVYNKNIPLLSNNVEYSGFSQDEISRGIFVYKRDIDQWFPIPCLETRFINACMTCDDEGIVYLIGGQNSNRVAQVYDPRTQGWSALPPTRATYDGAACCAYRNEIYVTDGLSTGCTEMYKSGYWVHYLPDLPKRNEPGFQLVNWNPKVCQGKILNFNRRLRAESPILCLYNGGPWNNDWIIGPNLFETTMRAVDEAYYSELRILDLVT